MTRSQHLRKLARDGLLCAGLGCALIAFFGGAEAQAQSHNEMMSEMSAQAFYADVQRRVSSGIDDGPSYYLSRDYTLTPEQERELAEQRKNDAELERLRQDPVLMRHVNGYWQFYQARDGAPPGEFCAATYNNLHGSITLSGVDKSWEGGMLMFVGNDIPEPAKFSTITATLSQTGEKPATVKIFNAPKTPGMKGHGMLIFAVPSMKGALSGMQNEQEFAVSIEGREVFRMSWKDGNDARAALRRCLQG